MLLPDVNILLFAHRPESRDHRRFRQWLEDLINSEELYGMSDLVLSSFVRVVTNSRIFQEPTSLEKALEFVDRVRRQPNCVVVSPGPLHWQVFTDLCRKAETRGNLVADAYLAALAIESRSEWITVDRDYSRFPGLRWRHPFDAASRINP